jgi:N6-L-threonylcarbamoyladenine synthase
VNSKLLNRIRNNSSFLLNKRCFNSSKYTVLGIETSCDDTAVGIVTTDRQILAEIKYNQWSVHRHHGGSKKLNNINHLSGGIVPNIARNLHRQNLITAVGEAIDLVPWSNIDAIALTTQPGLEVCLWEGINFTKILLQKYKKPLIPIHHMESHALTPRLFDKDLKFPYLTLLISGGHSILALVNDYNKFIRLGDGLDVSPGIFFSLKI